MASASMIERLLQSADDLLRLGERSAAYRRRAVSTAYYAVFHALAKLCAQTMLPDVRRDDETYARIYKALDHGPLRNAFLQPPLKSHAAIRELGPLIATLQTERHRADYAPPDKNLFAPSEVQEIINKARFVVDELKKLDKTDSCFLATCLLFKERKS